MSRFAKRDQIAHGFPPALHIRRGWEHPRHSRLRYGAENNRVLFLDHLSEFRRGGVPIEPVHSDGQIGFLESLLQMAEGIVTEPVAPDEFLPHAV